MGGLQSNTHSAILQLQRLAQGQRHALYMQNAVLVLHPKTATGEGHKRIVCIAQPTKAIHHTQPVFDNRTVEANADVQMGQGYSLSGLSWP
jgi:hypothetical protein